MKHMLTALFVILFFVACNDDDGDSNSPKLPRRVVIAYIMGENNLTNYAEADLNEMREGVDNIPQNCRLVVFFDNSSTTEMPQILSFDSENGEQLLYEYPEDVVSTDGEVMEEALRFIVDNNPAEEYALILWSHGSGWMPQRNNVKRYTIGIDNGQNTTSNVGLEMEISTLKEVLNNIGVYWEYIFYDVCFMQCVEVAYELRHLTRWSLGSVAEVPANGAPYTDIMSALFEETNYCYSILETYARTYANNGGVLLSAIYSDELDALAEATKEAITPLTDYPTTGIQQYCTYSSVTGYKPEYYDMGSCIYHWAGQDAYEAWEKTLVKAVNYRYYTNTWTSSYVPTFNPTIIDAEHIALMSMYFPMEGRDEYNTAWRQYEWYNAVGYLFDR